MLFSVVASETSALTFISIPGLSYIGNLGFLQIVAGYILGRIVVAYTLLPRYYDGQLVTAYALLESRFGLTTRRFTSIVFMATRAVADSVRVFATAIPIALIVNVIRITATGVIFLNSTSHAASVFFHDLAGWFMMPLALGFLCLELWLLRKLFIEPTARPLMR